MGSRIKKPVFLAVCSILPYLFVRVTPLPVWDDFFLVAAAITGVLTVLGASFLVEKRYVQRFTSHPDRARNSLLGLAFLTGLFFPVIFFVVAYLIGFAREGMLFSSAGGPCEVTWAAVLMGAGFGWPMWLFSVPWAFVVVYGLANAQVSSSGFQVPGESLNRDEGDEWDG